MPPWREDVELQKLGIRLRHGHATAANPKVSARIEGGHASQFLYVFDEAKLIPSTTWDSAEGSAASATGSREIRWLAQSSGGDADGRFFEIHKGNVGGWFPRHVTLDEAVAAGRVSKAWADRMLDLWGEGSPAYQNHVLGNFAATGGTNTVIRMADVERAVERWKEWAKAGRPSASPRVLGVDVGTGNLDRDPATIAHRLGRVISTIDIIRFTEKYPEMQLAGIVSMLLERYGLAVVDAIGSGSGVVSRLEELGKNVAAFIASGKVDKRDRSGTYGFANLRAYMWWTMRESLADPASDIALPDDPILLGELTSPTWSAPNDRILIEGKDEIAKRLNRLESRRDQNEGGSTNRADAVLMAFWDGIWTGKDSGWLELMQGKEGAAEAGPAEDDAPYGTTSESPLLTEAKRINAERASAARGSLVSTTVRCHCGHEWLVSHAPEDKRVKCPSCGDLTGIGG